MKSKNNFIKLYITYSVLFFNYSNLIIISMHQNPLRYLIKILIQIKFKMYCLSVETYKLLLLRNMTEPTNITHRNLNNIYFGKERWNFFSRIRMTSHVQYKKCISTRSSKYSSCTQHTQNIYNTVLLTLRSLQRPSDLM